MSKILKINRPSDYNAWVGNPDSHDLISVVNYSELSPVRYSLNHYDVYGLFLQGNEADMDLVYGTGKYDYSEGTLICVAPGQLGGKEDTGELFNLTGWAVLFHPDLLQGTALENEIKSFSFFDYRINEALHMSEEERDVIISIIRQLENEMKFPSDEMQNRIIVGFLNLLLRYAQRFYNRQFVTRTIVNNSILSRFESSLKHYFDSDSQTDGGVPTVQFFADQLNMSASYLSDVIKKITGETAGTLIRQYVVQLAKNRLSAGMNSSEVAYSLGYEYPQHFARTFKKVTGITPTQYVADKSASKKDHILKPPQK
ncbi:MAG: helix-turn-helix domain-containing protein [Muribaculaceae bacterium]|nr:helix-turn-helix domain-containing protein [Muribaculaceae bacterium]